MSITPQNTEFVILCFEGPDRYSMAGGLSVRITNLSETLALMGFTTHLFFVGDPRLKGEEERCSGKLILHRWCQWISNYYPNGVYEGENEKLYDFNESIPWFVKDRIIEPAIRHGKMVVVLGEEWQTSEAMCRLSDLLHCARIRERVVMFWNANNVFSFHRIDWGRLNYTTTITTVSRYMKHLMWRMRLNPLVIPNGIPKSVFRKTAEMEAYRIRKVLGVDLILIKVARWDPDKRWNQAIEAVSLIKKQGLRTVFIVRGGMEPYGQEVIGRACSLGLEVKEAGIKDKISDGYLGPIAEAIKAKADIVDVKFHLPLEFLLAMYRAADGVLANSGHEPFGIVGLEAMASGGVAFTGGTGEDYAIHLINSFVLETADPREIVNYMIYLRNHSSENDRIRRTAIRTAHYFTWEASVHNLLGKLENQLWFQGSLSEKPRPKKPQFDPSELPKELLATTMKRHY